jgi:hypothetical protein
MKFRLTKTEKALVMQRLRQPTGVGQALADAVQAPPGTDVVKAIASVARKLARRLRTKRVIDTAKLSPVEQLILGDCVHNAGWLAEQMWDRAMSRRVTPNRYYGLARAATHLAQKVMGAGIRPYLQMPQPRELELHLRPRRR